MKYICASCKTIYDGSELNIDPMSSIQTCPIFSYIDFHISSIISESLGGIQIPT